MTWLGRGVPPYSRRAKGRVCEAGREGQPAVSSWVEGDGRWGLIAHAPLCAQKGRGGGGGMGWCSPSEGEGRTSPLRPRSHEREGGQWARRSPGGGKAGGALSPLPPFARKGRQGSEAGPWLARGDRSVSHVPTCWGGKGGCASEGAGCALSPCERKGEGKGSG